MKYLVLAFVLVVSSAFADGVQSSLAGAPAATVVYTKDAPVVQPAPVVKHHKKHK